MITYKISRRLDKMPFFFRNFIIKNNLWPVFSSFKNPKLTEFSVSSIEDDIRGNIIKKWQIIVMEYFQMHGHDCKLGYGRSISKQLLIFKTEEDATFFKLTWSN